MSNQTTTEILDTLNAYRGDNIWQDIIWQIPGIDGDASAALDPSDASDIFALTDGRTFRCEPSQGEWVTA